MPRGPTANWNRHQYKKAAMLAYAIAASAGLCGNVGKLCPAGRGESDQRAGAETGFSGFRFFNQPRENAKSAKGKIFVISEFFCGKNPGIGVERHTPVFQTGIEGALPSCPSISQLVVDLTPDWLSCGADFASGVQGRT